MSQYVPDTMLKQPSRFLWCHLAVETSITTKQYASCFMWSSESAWRKGAKKHLTSFCEPLSTTNMQLFFEHLDLTEIGAYYHRPNVQVHNDIDCLLGFLSAFTKLNHNTRPF
jgi:hypothetical protein